MTRKLTLRYETLGELTTDDLRAVAGGIPTQVGPPTVFECPDLTGNYPTLPVWWCVTKHNTW